MMTTENVRSLFNEIIKDMKEPDQIAKLEMLREYFTNSEFRKSIEDLTYNLNQKGI